MSAYSLAHGIRSFSANALLNAAHHSTSQTNATLLSGLDEILSHNEVHLAPGDFVELQGGPSSGKTSLLLQLAMTALLPAHLTLACEGGVSEELQVGGRGRGVVWADCDGRLDVERLAALMRAHLARIVREAVAEELAQGRTIVPQEIDHQLNKVISSALEHMLVLPSSSTLQLAATLEVLPSLWVATPRPGLLYLLIDGLSEFCWDDQRQFEQNQTRAPLSSSVGQRPSSTPPLQLLLAALAHLKSTLAPITFITNWILQPLAVTSRSTTWLGQNFGLAFVAQHLPAPWPQIVGLAHVGPPGDPLRAQIHPKTGLPTIGLKVHVTCFKLPREPMKSGTLLKEALKKRREERRAGERFVGLVRVAGTPARELGAWEFEVEEGVVSA